MNHVVSFPRAQAHALAAALRREVRGEVRFDAGSRALYATDSSNYRQLPIGVVVPVDAADVVAAVAVCREHDAPLLPRGGGTSLAGQCCNVAVVLDFSKYMNRVLEVDAKRRVARVQPGAVLDDLRHAAAVHGLTFGPDPSTHNRCTLGGMIGNNSCGVHSLRGRRTTENVEALDVLTYDGTRLNAGATPAPRLERLAARNDRTGQIYSGLRTLAARYATRIRERYPDIPRRVSGYNLPQLLPESGFHVARALVGSEGTCATVLEATLKLIDKPPAVALALLGFRDICEAARHVPEVVDSGCIGLEGIDAYLVQNMRRRSMHEVERRLLPEGAGWLLVEFGGESAGAAAARAQQLVARLGNGVHGRVFEDEAEQEQIWTLREAGLGATALEQGENATWEGWEDAAVPPARLAEYLRAFQALLARYGYHGALYGHFGDGCVHTRINFDLKTAPGIEKWKHFLVDAADLVVSHGGSLSGEHGDGQSRAQLLPRMFGDDLVEAFGAFKRVWDPAGRMNPGKVVEPFAPDENLRLGVDYRPPQWETRFTFPDDRGSFAQAALRCVGVGACRKHDAGTMCPSYMATHEERHSTRGRARLLFEMLQGEALRDGWRSAAVDEALDLCLSCKACKHECPVQVDMATYKAEFLYHHHRGRVRPPDHYLLGYLGAWVPLAARAPRLVNALTQSRLAGLGKRLTGLAPQRHLPQFVQRTFREAFAAHDGAGHGAGDGAGHGDGREVLLWPDTFNEHFSPSCLEAAAQVLQSLGWRVVLPPQGVCCGRPYYDFGLLDPARRTLERTVRRLRPWLRRGVPIVGLEPSCMAVFRDELPNLLANDEDARRLAAQATLFDEFVEAQLDGVEPAAHGARVLVHGHCHQKALFDAGATGRVLGRLGYAPQVLDAGCCGLAGAFGFRHFEVSRDIGERALFPALRAAPEVHVVADGFSCREQIRQFTDRDAHHLAELMLPVLTRSTSQGD